MADRGEHNGWRGLLTWRWVITTLLVIAAAAVMVRLGFWQLDRLAQRRAFNAAVTAQMNAPQLNLNAELTSTGLKPADLLGMEYRPAVVTGVYDPANQVVLRNQVANNLPGYHLLTPLKLDGASGESVLVDRGFIPMDEKTPADWVKYAQPGPVTVTGILRLGHVPRLAGVADPPLAPGQTRLSGWNNLNMTRIAAQMPYPLLPVYLQAAPAGPAAAAETAPLAALDQPDLSEGPHLGYAAQWFSFAAILAVGYPFFVRKQLRAPGGPDRSGPGPA